MNKKSNNNLVPMIAILIAVVVLAFTLLIDKINIDDSTTDILVFGFLIIVAIITYVGFHLKETKEINDSKTTKETIEKSFNYYSRNAKYFQRISIIALVIYVAYQVKNTITDGIVNLESISYQVIANIITSIIAIYILGVLSKFFENSSNAGTPFNKENVKLLNLISKLFLILLLVNHNVLSIVIFIFAEVISVIFKLGVELQEENDNTI